MTLLGNRIAIIGLLIACLMVSACSPTEKIPFDPVNAGQSITPNNMEKPVEYTQKTEALPEINTLTTFPGVLESMSLTLEQIITVLGHQFYIDENKAQGYDSYFFNEYNLVYEFDKVSKKLSTIWLDEVPYYVYSGTYETQDLNGDGKLEKIIAYEDENFMGSILVTDGANAHASELNLGFFGAKCEIEVILEFGQHKENLILVKTSGGRQGDILKWSNGELISILPQGYDSFSKEALVTVEGNKAVLVHEKENILYVCPLPDRLAKSMSGRATAESYRYNINLKSEVLEDSLYLKVRTSLQLKLSDNYNFIDSSDGTFCDVAQVTRGYQYLGQGKWQETGTTGGPKYENAPAVALLAEDLAIGNLALYGDVQTMDQSLLKHLFIYTPDELRAGVLIKGEGIQVGITQQQITYLSLEEGSDKATFKGLKLTDTREKVLSIYGLPDKGFLEDSEWTYYVVREEQSKGNLSVSVDTLNLEFDGEKVSRIWLSAFVTASDF